MADKVYIAEGSYPAGMACYIDNKEGKMAKITEEQNDSCVTEVTKGTVVGYKYFSFVGASMMIVEIRGAYEGDILVASDPQGRNVIGEFETQINKQDWICELIPLMEEVSGKQEIYFIFNGEGTLDMKRFAFLNM